MNTPGAAPGTETLGRSRSAMSVRPAPPPKKCPVHCNSLWSLWYGLLTLALQAYVVYKCVTRFLTYIALPWPEDKQPYLELNLYVGLVGAGVVLLPFFFISFMFKIGNLPNDGYKLGYNLSTCSMDPPSVLARSAGREFYKYLFSKSFDCRTCSKCLAPRRSYLVIHPPGLFLLFPASEDHYRGQANRGWLLIPRLVSLATSLLYFQLLITLILM